MMIKTLHPCKVPPVTCAKWVRLVIASTPVLELLRDENQTGVLLLRVTCEYGKNEVKYHSCPLLLFSTL